MKILNDYEKGYIEGTLDGEGCLTIYRIKRSNNHYGYYLNVSWVNTKIEFLEKIKEILGSSSKIYNHNYGKGNRNPTYLLRLTSNEIPNILNQINLVIKEEQRKILLEATPLIIHGKLKTVIELRRNNEEKLRELYLKLRSLNIKGRKNIKSIEMGNIST